MLTMQRILSFLLLVSLSCAAQSLPPDVVRKIEHQVRVTYKISADAEVTVGTVAMSTDIPGFDVVPVTIASADPKADLKADQKKDYIFLVSKDRRTLIRLTKFDLDKDAFDDVMSHIDVKGRPVRGAKSASVTVVVYDDFECPFCARAYQTLFPQILKDYGDRASFILKDEPVESIHPWAMHAGVDANCLAAQSSDAYWDFADELHARHQEVDNQRANPARFDFVDKIAVAQGEKHQLNADKLQACIKAQDETAIRKSMEEAKAVGVNGAVPAIFINGQKIEGAVPANIFRAALDRALKESGSSPAARASSTQAPAANRNN
jgi:protein-disulfide isomerase